MIIESGLLELLEEGDSVMADKGFTVADILYVHGVSLNIALAEMSGNLTKI